MLKTSNGKISTTAPKERTTLSRYNEPITWNLVSEEPNLPIEMYQTIYKGRVYYAIWAYGEMFRLYNEDELDLAERTYNTGVTLVEMDRKYGKRKK